MWVETLPVYSRFAEMEEVPPAIQDRLPQGLRLYRHQAATFRALTEGGADVIFNTALTGDGKSLAGQLPALVRGWEWGTLAMYPTNELVRDQEAQLRLAAEQWRPDLRWGELYGARLDDIMAGGDYARRGDALLSFLHNHDVVLTNPPFGGEEERGILGNFPEDKQTAETAMLFLQLIMRRLRRQSGATGKPGRAAVVVPNGTLYGDGVCARIKSELLNDFNLHTVIRLPNGVFAPYTGIPTNILFFDAGSKTDSIWFYEIRPPEGKNSFSKTNPISLDDFSACLQWWSNRSVGQSSWAISAKSVLVHGKDGVVTECNLDSKNPSVKSTTHRWSSDHVMCSYIKREVEAKTALRASRIAAMRRVLDFEIWPDALLEDAKTLDAVTTYLARGRHSSQGDSRICLIKTQHVQMGHCIESDLRLSPTVTDKVLAEQVVRKGDILIACSAAGCLGRVARFLQNDVQAVTDTHIAVARPNVDLVNPEYLYLYLLGSQGQHQLRSRERGDWQREKVSFRLTELNLRDLKQVPVPCPRREVQEIMLRDYAISTSVIKETIDLVLTDIDAYIDAALLRFRQLREGASES